MAELIILEGSRMQWKSTIAQGLRSMLEGSTLINFTGFKADGQEGLTKMRNYYRPFLQMFQELPFDAKIICDRIFFSEKVYSSLYKSYDFSEEYLSYMWMLAHPYNKVRIYHLTASQDALAQRLGREKVSLFGQIDDNLQELTKQRDKYTEVMHHALEYYERNKLDNVSIMRIDTTEFESSRQVRDVLIKDILE